MFDNLTTPGTIDDERNGMNHMHIKLAPGSHMQRVDLSRIMGNSNYTEEAYRLLKFYSYHLHSAESMLLA